jgi:trimeric autotransporter adhesin
MNRTFFYQLLILNFLCLLFNDKVEANPENPTVIQGNAQFYQNKELLEVNAGNRTIINWEAFSIAPNETTRFNLPDAHSVALNRVTSFSPSVVEGLLSSNGTVYLINPQGVMITPSGKIDTAGFLASTLDISDQDFLKDGQLLFSGDSLATVINQGTISCADGDVILIAYRVANENLIDAPNGIAALAAAQEVLLIPEENQRVSVRLKSSVSREEMGVLQTGTIRAIQEELKADGNLYAYAIKNEGTLQAVGCEEREGKIFLVAEEGFVESSGTLIASNREKGGEIRILGKMVKLTEEAEIDASGTLGGGTVLIGGDFQGKSAEVFNAQYTVVDADVTIKADALSSGDGGKVIVWADKIAAYRGCISAQGGESQGDGGFVEVSGLENLEFNGLVNTLAPNGNVGTLLLDPTTVTISNAADANFTISVCGPPITYTPTANTGTVNIANLITNLSTCNVTITSTSVFAGTGDITFASGAPFTWATVLAAARTLTLNADRDIIVNAAITNTTTGNPGSIVFNANRNITNSIAGTITYGAGAGSLAMTAATGNIIIGGVITYGSSNPFSMTATAGSIIQNPTRTISISTAAPFTMQAPVGSITIFDRVRNTSTGTISITCGGDLTVGYTDLIHPVLPVQIGSHGGDLTFSVGGNVIMTGGNADNAFTQIGYDDATTPINSNITFTKLGGSLIMTGGFRNFDYVVIGHGVQSTGGGAGGTMNGNITIGSALNPVGGNILLAGREADPRAVVGMNSFAQIGHLNSLSGPTTTATGDIDLSHVTGKVVLASGNRTDTYTLIGHGGGTSPQADSFTGSIKVHSGTGMDITLTSGLANDTFASIGHTSSIFTGLGTVNINSALIEVIAGGSISLFAQQTGARIGGYVRTATGTGNVVVTNTHVKTNTGDILMTGANPGANFNAAFIGAISYTGGAPIIAAGSASTTLLVEAAGLLKMQNGIGGSSTSNFTLIQNGIGTPIGGPFSTTITCGTSLSLFGGNNISEIHSIGPLTITCGDVLALIASPVVPSPGDALIQSAGTTSISANSISLIGEIGGAKAAIENSLNNLSITATNNILVFNNADVKLTAGSGNLNITSTAGSLTIVSDALVGNLGTGAVNLTIAQSGFVEGGVSGGSAIQSQQNLTATFGDTLLITSTIGGAGSITSNGNTTISATNSISGVGVMGFPVLIANATGGLSLSSQLISFKAFSNVNLTGGAGLLNVSAGTGGVYLGQNSTIHNFGSGTTSVTMTGSFLISGDPLGISGVISNQALSVNADRISMAGTAVNSGVLTAGQGNLTLTANNAVLGPNATVSLTGGSGQLSATLTNDLAIFNNSDLSNLGTGNTVITTQVLSLVAGAKDAKIVNTSGTLTMNLSDNLNLYSNIGGSAFIISSGPININAQNITLGGLATGQQSFIQGSVGDMILIAQNDISLTDNALIQNTGLGQLTLVVDNQSPVLPGPGRFILDPDAQLITASGSGLRIFTSRPNGIATGNLAFGKANGIFVTTGLACPFDAPPSSATYQYGTPFPSLFGGVPFTIFFKQP